MRFRRPALSVASVIVAAAFGQVQFSSGQAVDQSVGTSSIDGGSTIPGSATLQDVPPLDSPFDRDRAEGVGAGDGADYVAHAALLLRIVPHLQAAVRCKTDMGKISAIGTGSYAQSTVGDRRRVRLELDLSVGETLRAQFLTVSDGDVVWTRKRLPQKESLERLRLQKLRKELSASAGVDPRIQIAEGGLSRLLFAMNDSFAFGPPRRDTLDGEPVWVVEGLWKPERLEARYPEIAESLRNKKVVELDGLPERTPTGARLYLRRGERLQYFPHRIEFTRQETSHPRSASRTVLQYDLFEVRELSTMDDSLFRFDAEGQVYDDKTEAFRAKHFPDVPTAPESEPVAGELTARRAGQGAR